MDTDLDTLATALYVTTDDLLTAHPERVPARPRIGIAPRISDAELLTLAVMQALLGYVSETRWLRYARANLLAMFPDLPGQSGYNKRLRKLADTMVWLIDQLAAQTPIADDDVWLVDSTPVECARSRETVKRSDLAGWGRVRLLRLPLPLLLGTTTPSGHHLHGLPLGWALTGAKADEREVFTQILTSAPALADVLARARQQHDRRQITIADKNYYGRHFEAGLEQAGIELLRPARKGESPRAGQRFFKPLRQIIESVNDTLKGQLDLERHGGRTIAGVCTRIAQRILALTAAIWYNDLLAAPVRRSLTAYDH